MPQYIVSLNEYDFCTQEKVGGKASRLSQLMQHGFSVPKAYALTTEMFDEFCRHNQINLNTSQAKREILQGQFSSELQQKIDELKRSFKDCKVAIRSSGVGEDGYEHSLAGQLKSFLDVDQWEQSIRECWAAIFMDRVEVYMKQQGKQSLRKMGVIVQELVEADYAGVFYSVDPREKNGDVGIVEWVDGLADKLVDGAITPNRCSISRLTKTPIQLDEKDKEKALGQLADAVYRIEKMMNYPVDVEWAVKNEGVYILQARPVTAFYSRDCNILSSANIAENFPGALTPLTKDVSVLFYEQYMRSSLRYVRCFDHEYHNQNMLGSLLSFYQGRIFYNLSNWYAVFNACPFSTWIKRGFDLYVGQTVPSPSQSTYNKSLMSLLPQRIKSFSLLIWRLIRSEQDLKVFETHFKKSREYWKSQDCRALSPVELAEYWRNVNAWSEKHWGPAGFADFTVLVTSGLIQSYIEEVLTSEQAEAVRGMLGGIVVDSTDSAKIIENIADLAAKNDVLSHLLQERKFDEIEKHLTPQIREQYDEFMQEFGGRSYNESVLTSPTLEEQPRHFWELVRVYLNKPQSASTPPPTSQTENEVSELGELPWRTRIAQKAIKRFANRSLNHRERGRLIFGLYMAEIRRAALAIGERFTLWKYLESAEDIFYLSSQEVIDTLEGRQLYASIKETIELRKQQQTDHKELNLPEFLVWEHGKRYGRSATDIRDTATRGNSLIGLGVSSGRVSGKACVVIDPSQNDQDIAGNILIASTTDPGWTPLIACAAGLIVERGGLLSHAAIVAREFGIPTVVGINGVTQLIKSGTTVTVDGDAGIVDLAMKESA